MTRLKKVIKNADGTETYIYDVEPKWEHIVRNVLNRNNLEALRPELIKIAKVADAIRQAQKDESREVGAIGGEQTKKKHGKEHFKKIGSLGGKRKKGYKKVKKD